MNPYPRFLTSIFVVFFCFFFNLSLGFPANPDPVNIQPLPLPVTSSPPATIPAFPEQSDVAGCPLDLPDELFYSIKNACSVGKGGVNAHLHRSRCCPVLAAWLYAAYSTTALSRVGRVGSNPGMADQSTPYDLPLLPDDSETCVNNFGKALSERGIELVKPNETCDAVYCNCGIRLHPLSCPESFSVTKKGKLVGDASVRRLERNCLSSSSSVSQLPGLGGCSKCLNSLNHLNKKRSLNASKPEDRPTKMHKKECQLMGLTWLLAKNRTAYIRTVSAVLRAKMMSLDGSDPKSCTLNSDGMPLAVDSTEIANDSPPDTVQSPWYYLLFSLSLLYIGLRRDICVTVLFYFLD